MSLLRRTFRSWWQVPRNYGERAEERRVTFLELFYDLVYVVLVAELAHALSTHVDLAGLTRFAFLFTLLWWAWINGALYHDVHGNNDFRTRVATFLQMFTVAAMAVFAHDALGSGAPGFALSYAAFLLILSLLWWRTGVHDPEHRPLSQRRPWPRRDSHAAWFILHLPMTMGIAAAGAAVLNVVENAGQPLTAGPRWLLMGSLALVLVTIAALMRSIRVPAVHLAVYRQGGLVTAGTGLAILLLGATPLDGIPLLALAILIMLLPVFFGLKSWILMLDEAGSPEAVSASLVGD